MKSRSYSDEKSKKAGKLGGGTDLRDPAYDFVQINWCPLMVLSGLFGAQDRAYQPLVVG